MQVRYVEKKVKRIVTDRPTSLKRRAVKNIPENMKKKIEVQHIKVYSCILEVQPQHDEC